MSKSWGFVRSRFIESYNRLAPLPKDVRVHHGGGKPGIGGPTVKLWRMQQYFPDHVCRYNIIYSVCGSVPVEICRKARERGVKVVCHINSVYHPAYRPDHGALNAPFRDIYLMADHIVYGSHFAYMGAQCYLGVNSRPYSVVYNGVDTQHFSFSDNGRPEGRFNVLAIGVHYIRHRLVPLIQAMPHVIRIFPHAKLMIVGPLVPGEGLYDCSEASIRRVISEVGLENVEFYPQYLQQEAPELYALGDVLVHLKHMDWTPNTVIEAMACGLPVVHAGNGGMNELVGEAGVSLDLPLDWNQVHTPDPLFLAESIIEAHNRRQELGKMARRRALERYDMQIWADVHRKLFRSLLDE